jgi:hypothetical protein
MRDFCERGVEVSQWDWTNQLSSVLIFRPIRNAADVQGAGEGGDGEVVGFLRDGLRGQ